MSFNLPNEHVACESIEAFRRSLHIWVGKEQEHYERAVSVFKPFSVYNWHKGDDISALQANPELQKSYCMFQTEDLKLMKARRIRAMQACIVYKNKQHDLLETDALTFNKAKICQRDALLMAAEVKKQRMMDLENLNVFASLCKSHSYGGHDKAGYFTSVDYTKYEKPGVVNDVNPHRPDLRSNSSNHEAE